jgi:hypothetical protein
MVLIICYHEVKILQHASVYMLTLKYLIFWGAAALQEISYIVLFFISYNGPGSMELDTHSVVNQKAKGEYRNLAFRNIILWQEILTL